MRKLLLFGCGFALSCAVCVYLQLPLWMMIAVGAVGLILGLIFLKALPRRRVIAFTVGLLCGVFCFMAHEAFEVLPLRPLDGLETDFRVQLTHFPVEGTYSSSAQGKLLLQNKTATCLIYFPNDSGDLAPGDFVCGHGTLSLTQTNPNEDDFYGAAKGRWLTVRPEDDCTYEKGTVLLTAYPQIWARALQDNIRKIFPQDVQGLFRALITGDRGEIPYALKTDMKICGVYHAVSLSGMHVSILAALIMLLCGGQRRLAAVLGIPILFLFVLLSGAAPSTCRAAFMQAILLIAPLLHREYDSPTALAFALTLLLLINPYAIADWGLQFSFTSTAGILLLGGRLQSILIRPKWREGSRYALLRYVLSGISVSLSAILLSQPLMTAYFGMASLAALPVNILCLWAITVCFAGGMAVSLLGFVFMPLAAILAAPLTLCCRYVIWLVSAVARFPFAAIYTQTPLMLAWVELFYLLLVLAVCLHLHPGVLVLGMTLTFLCSFALTLSLREKNFFSLLDVGQGQCALYCNEKTSMVDCGGDGDETGELAARYLLSQGKTKLDALILTHFDADHTDGIEQLAHRIPIARVYYSDYLPETDNQKEILQILGQSGAELFAVKGTENFAGNTMIALCSAESDENNAGLCAVLDTPGGDIVLTGDADTAGEKQLLYSYDFGAVRALVAGHHGSKYSTGDKILDALSPQAVLCSVGENLYGHPSEEVRARLRERQIPFYTTQNSGTLIIRW